jgi:hypothetical protein
VRSLKLPGSWVGTELRDESRSRTLAFLQSSWPADLKPVRDLLGVKAIARLWLYDNVLFPWDNEAEAGEFEWPWRPIIQTSSSVRPCAWRIANFLNILEFAMHKIETLTGQSQERAVR